MKASTASACPPHVVDALPAVQGLARTGHCYQIWPYYQRPPPPCGGCPPCHPGVCPFLRVNFSAPLPAPVPHLVVDALLAVQALKAHASEHKQPSVAAQLQRRAVAALQQGPQQQEQQGQQRNKVNRKAACSKALHVKSKVPGSTTAGQYAQYILGCYLPARLHGINNLGPRQQELLCWSTLHSVHACTSP